MRHALLTFVSILSGSGPACGGDDGGAPDAAPAPDAPAAPDAPFGGSGSAFACAGQPLPTTAPDPLTVTGETIDIDTLAPLAGVTVSAFRTGSATALGTTTSDGSGDFSATATSGGVPIDGFLQASGSGYLDTYLYAAGPLAADAVGVQIPLITQQNLDTVTAGVGVTQAAENGAMLVRVTDCTGVTLAGATIATTPAGEIRYSANNAPSTTATMTDPSGVAFIYNVPPGTVTVDAMLGARALRARVVAVHADAGTVTSVQP